MQREAPGVRERRIELYQRATLAMATGDVVEVMVMNLSRTGFRIRHDGLDLIQGEGITLTSQRGATAAGVIKWTTGRDAGGIFVDVPQIPA